MATRQMTFLREAAAQNVAAPKLTTGERKLDFLYAGKSDNIKNRGGIAGGLEYVGASLAAGVGGVFEGTYDLVAGSLAALSGNKAYAENLFGTNVVGEWHKNIADGYNPNKAMKFVGDVSSGLGQSATMLIPYAGPVLFYAGAIGGGIGSATEKTGELGFKEYAYGTTVGVIEGLLETYLGSAGQALDKVTKGATKSLMTKLTSNVAKDWAASAVWKGVAKDMLSNAAGEFFEEAISEAIDPVLQRGFRIDEDASTSMKEILYAGLVGFGSGLVMGGASTAISTGTAYKVGKRSIDNGNAELVVRDAHTVIDALKIDENTKDIAPYLEGLKSSLESYELAADKKSDAATIYLGQVQGYMSAVESSWAVIRESVQLAGVSENAAKSFAEFMSYADKVGDVSKNYTAQDWYSDKNKIRTRYAAFKWAGAFLGDTVEMAESVAFDEEIRADREGRKAGTPVVQDIADATFTGESGTFNVSSGEGQTSPEGDYLRIIKLQDGTYSIARGNSSEQVRGYRSLTREQAQAEFERIKGAVATERSKVAQNQNLEGQSATDNNVGGTEQATDGMYANIPTEQTFENPYTAEQMNAARRAVKNFDMLTSDQKGRILRWMQSVEGKGIDADVVSGVANIIRLRPDLQVMLGETKEGVAGFRTGGVAGRNLIVIPSGKGNDILFETIAHEIGHDVESVEGFDELKKAAIEATKEEDIKKWEKLYEGYPDADTEVAMKALGCRLATPRFIQRYANKSMLGHLIDSCKQMIDKLRADDARKLEIETAKKLMRMLDGALVADNVHALEKNAGKKQHLFVGVKADTADKMKLATAQDMIANGVDPEQVRQETGWFRGYDGKWRFEIDDFDSALIENPNLMRHVDDGEVYFTGKLSDIFDHSDLYKAYPQLKDINIVIQKTDVGVDAIYQPKSNYITLSRDHFKRYTKAYNDYLNGGRKTEIEQIEQTPEFLEYNKWYDDEIADNMDATEWLKGELEARQKFFSSELGKRYHQLKYSKDGFAGEKFELGWSKEAKAVILHELQHAVQNIEGFATGTNTRDPNYDRNAGEIEAFDTGRRADLTAEQRKNTRPDIDRTDVVFADRFGDNFAIAVAENNKPVVVVNDDITRYAANDADLIKAVKESIGKLPYVALGKQKIYFLNDTKGEATYSKYTQWIRKNAPAIYADKMRLFNHPSEIVLATTDYVNEGLKHKRKDDIVDFARGELLVDILGNQYSAEVVIGFTKAGVCELHDVVQMKPTTFKYKKRDALSATSHKNEHPQKRSSLDNSIPQKSEKSTPSAKKTYNLTPEAAEREARDAAEVAEFLNGESIREDAEKTLEQAERARRTAKIQRIETIARDNNAVYWKYDDVRDAMKEMRKEASLHLREPQELTFEVYRALNHIRRRLEGKELESTLDGLFDLVADIYEQQTGKSFRTSVKQSNAIDAALRKLYEEKAKQTPRDKQRQRVDYAEGQAKLKTLLDRIDRRRATLKKSKGSLANKEWQNLVEAAHRIRPRFELSYDGIKDFIDTFIAFADRHASVAVSAAKASLDAKTDADAERAAQELKKFAEERTAGQNQLLDFIDPKLIEAMLTLQGAMTPGKDAEGNDIEVKKLITPAMLDAASTGIQRMLAMDSRVDKIFRNGRWEHVETVSGEMLNKYSYAYRGRTAKSENRKVLRELIRNGIMAAVDPETAVHLVEGVFGDTTLSEGIHIIKMAYEIARNDRDKWLKQFDDFQKDKAHRAWRKAWNEGEMTLKWASYTIDGKPVTQEITVTKQEAAQLYMTSKRTQARAALALGRLEFSETTGKGGRRLAVRKVGVSNETVDQMLSMEEGELNSLMLKMEQAANMAVNDLYRQFSAEDKQYIKLMEKFYNGTSKNVKKICDTEYYGYTNVIDGYYVPISRGDTTYDIDLIASRVKYANDVSVSGYSFNHATVKGARSRLVIGSAQAVLERHAQQLSLYKNMTHPLQNMQRLYNYRQSSATDNVYSVREFIHDYAWDGMDAYLSNYFKDVQGMRTAYDTTSQMFRKAKGGYAKAVLGLNLASGIKQLSSFLQLPGVASIKAVMRGLSPELIRSSRKEIDKYSKLAENRHSNVEMYYAAGASGKIGAVGDVLMKHLELGDRAATVLFWSVAQAQAEIDGKGAVGTESNKEYAGKLVDKWILLIQDTSAPTTKSALARHPQELVSAMTMFQSSAMKIFSRAVNSIHELYLLGQMAKRTDLSSEEKARVKEAQEKAGKAAAVLGGTILAAATFESIVGLIRDKIRGNDDEEESDAKRIAVDTMLNVMGTVPVLGGFAESAFSGYDITEFYTDFLNDGITATRNMANVTAKVAAGEAVESEDILKALKGVTVFSGQLMGIPVNNAMNIVKSTLNMTSPGAAYRYEAMFYEPTYTADLAKAVKSGKTELAEVIYRMAQKDIKTGGAAADAVVSEMVRLYGEGHNVLPRSAPTTYEDAEGNSVKLRAAQVRQFSEIYGTADGVAAMVATSPVYAGLPDELKAKALRISYEVYHSRAKSEVLGSELSVIAALSYLEDYIDVPTLISESAYIYGIKSADGIKRSELVKSYISGYSPEAQAILLYAAGYRSEQVKELLASVVASLDEDVQNRVKKVLDF